MYDLADCPYYLIMSVLDIPCFICLWLEDLRGNNQWLERTINHPLFYWHFFQTRGKMELENVLWLIWSDFFPMLKNKCSLPLLWSNRSGKCSCTLWIEYIWV